MCITNKHQLFIYLLKAYTVIASSTTQGFEEDEINVPLTLSVFRDKELSPSLSLIINLSLPLAHVC